MSRVEFSGASSFNKLSIRSRKGRTTYARGSSTPHRARSNLDGARRRSQRKYIKTSSSGLSRGELVGKPASQPAVARLRVSRRGPTIFMFDQLPHRTDPPWASAAPRKSPRSRVNSDDRSNDLSRLSDLLRPSLTGDNSAQITQIDAGCRTPKPRIGPSSIYRRGVLREIVTSGILISFYCHFFSEIRLQPEVTSSGKM